MNTVLFDLDGTLLPLDHGLFERLYFKSIAQYLNDYCDSELFLNALSKAIYQTIMDTSSRTIEDSFYDYFSAILGEEKVNQLKPLFDDYYDHFFIETKVATSQSQDMIDAVNHLKEKGYNVAIVTNPLFPQKAIDARINWAGFKRDDFTYVTAFETNTACKPHTALFEEVLEHIGKNPNECLMVGNHALEDMVAGTLGMKTYLVLDDYLDHEKKIEPTKKGSRNDFLTYVMQLPSIN